MAKTSGKAKARRGPRGVEGKRGVPGIEPEEIHTIIANMNKSRTRLRFNSSASPRSRCSSMQP